MQSAQDNLLKFWDGDDKRRDQMLYTAFCLIESATENLATGLSLQERKVYDWASTAFYYSMVYSARLMVFLSDGDFPTGHSTIAKLFTPEQVTDWAWFLSLSKQFDPPLVNMPSTEGIVFDGNCIERSLIRRGVSQKLSKDVFEFFREKLAKAGKLRNDASYESLLVAHQYNHRLVTTAFRDLGKHFEGLSRQAVKTAALVLREIADKHSRREYFRAFLVDEENGEGLCYLRGQLEERFSKPLVEDCLSYLSCLNDKHGTNSEYAKVFHQNITIDAFDAKRKLMDDFKKKIESL